VINTDRGSARGYGLHVASRVFAGEGTALVRCSAREVLALAADPERYRRVDTKIARVLSVRREGNSGRMRIVPRLRSCPLLPVELRFRLVPDQRLDIWIPCASPARLLGSFRGTLLCEEQGDRTRVTHREELSFRIPLAWIAGPLVRDWLAQDTKREVERFAALLGDGATEAP
jgi:hypothetical protein